MKRLYGSVAALAAMLACGTLAAQVPRAMPRAGQAPRVSDAEIAMWLIPGNEAEVALGQLAQREAKSDAVKVFAQRMVEDHTRAIQRLQAAAEQPRTDAPRAGTAPATPGVTPGAIPGAAPGTVPGVQPVQPQPVQSQPGTTGAQPVQPQPPQVVPQPPTGAAPAQAQPGAADTAIRDAQRQRRPGGSPWIRIHRSIGERGLALTQRELGQHRGAEFDKAYIGQQIVSHVKMLAALETLEPLASGDLRNDLANVRNATQEHLVEAKRIMKQLDGGEEPRAATAPSDSERR